MTDSSLSKNLKAQQVIDKAKQGFAVDLFAYDYDRVHLDDQHLSTLLNLCPLINGKQYLDLGTGNGYVAFELAREISDIQVTGIDIVPEAVEANNQSAKINGYANLNFVTYQGLELPFDGHKFFGVISRYAFHHFPDPALSAREIGRIIEDDGFCVIADPTPNKLDETDFINQFAALKDDGHVRFHTQEGLEAIFGGAGFNVAEKIKSSITFPRKMNGDYRRLIERTPDEILEAYQLQIEDNLVYVTVEVLNTCFRL